MHLDAETLGVDAVAVLLHVVADLQAGEVLAAAVHELPVKVSAVGSRTGRNPTDRAVRGCRCRSRAEVVDALGGGRRKTVAASRGCRRSRSRVCAHLADVRGTAAQAVHLEVCRQGRRGRGADAVEVLGIRDSAQGDRCFRTLISQEHCGHCHDRRYRYAQCTTGRAIAAHLERDHSPPQLGDFQKDMEVYRRLTSVSKQFPVNIARKKSPCGGYLSRMRDLLSPARP